jgi:hypothetical protein
MKKLTMIAAICGAAAFGLSTGASAAPISAAKIIAAADLNIVDLVHGCHRDVRVDRFGPHYHGRRCRRINVGYQPVCTFIGPFRVCQ